MVQQLMSGVVAKNMARTRRGEASRGRGGTCGRSWRSWSRCSRTTSKCYWMWNYRRWILDLAIERLDVATARRIWEEELGLDTNMLTRDRRNYHAWAYRRYLVAKLRVQSWPARAWLRKSSTTQHA